MRLRLLCICVGVVQVGQGAGQRSGRPSYHRASGQGQWQKRPSQYYDDYYSDDYYYDDDYSSVDKQYSSRDGPYAHQTSYTSREKAEARQGGAVRAPAPGLAPLVFLAPLAGLAALYAMAYVNTNPALLTLTSISGRKKRAVDSMIMSDRRVVLDKEEEQSGWLQEVGALSRYVEETPGLDLMDQRDMLMASVVECSSLGSSECLDMLVCEFSRPQSSYNSVEKDTITMVLYHLLSSSHLPDTIKSRIRIAAGLGKQNHCHIFTCEVNPDLLQA